MGELLGPKEPRLREHFVQRIGKMNQEIQSSDFLQLLHYDTTYN